MSDFAWAEKIAEKRHMTTYNELAEQYPFMVEDDLLKEWHDFPAHEQRREAAGIVKMLNAMRNLGIVIQFPDDVP